MGHMGWTRHIFLTVNSHLSGLIMVKGMGTDRSGHSNVLETLMMITVFFIMHAKNKMRLRK